MLFMNKTHYFAHIPFFLQKHVFLLGYSRVWFLDRFTCVYQKQEHTFTCPGPQRDLDQSNREKKGPQKRWMG